MLENRKIIQKMIDSRAFSSEEIALVAASLAAGGGNENLLSQRAKNRDRQRKFRSNAKRNVTATLKKEIAEQNQQTCNVTVTLPENEGIYVEPMYVEAKEESKEERKKVSNTYAREEKISDFDPWYERYPRKTAKDHAKKAWLKARKTATAEQIIAGLDRYNASIAPDFDQKFHPYPATWLNRKRWEDDHPIQLRPAKPLTWRQKNEETLAKLQQYSDSLPDDRRTGSGAQVGNPLGAPDNPFISTDGGNFPRIRSGFG